MNFCEVVCVENVDTCKTYIHDLKSMINDLKIYTFDLHKKQCRFLFQGRILKNWNLLSRMGVKNNQMMYVIVLTKGYDKIIIDYSQLKCKYVPIQVDLIFSLGVETI